MIIYLKRLQCSGVQAFPMYGGLGMSTPSLHRESTDSLMIFTLACFTHFFSSHKHGQDIVGSLASLNAIAR